MKDKTCKFIFWWAMAAILIFAPLARGAVRIWSITPLLLVAYSLVFIWLWRSINNIKAAIVLGDPNINLPIFLFTLLAVLSFIFSIYKYDSFLAILRFFAYIGIYYFLLHNFDKAMFKRLLVLVIIIGTGLSLFGILQYFGILGHSWWVPREFLASTYVNHNHFAGYLELTIPLSIGVLFSRQSKGRRFALILALAVMITAFIIAQSRGAWFFLVVSLLVMNIVFIRNKIVGKSSLVIFLLSVSIIFSLAYLKEGAVSERMKTIGQATVNKESREASFGARLLMWQGALNMIKEKPLLGVGIGDFDSGFYRYRPKDFNARAVYAHNEYLHVAAEMGIPAFVIMLWFFTALISIGFKKKNSPWVIGCAVGVLSLALHGLVDFNFHIPANMLLITVFAAYIMNSSCSPDL